jgi:hypothetical protein
MESLGKWIDEKSYRFTLILLVHTAAFCAALMTAARF